MKALGQNNFGLNVLRLHSTDGLLHLVTFWHTMFQLGLLCQKCSYLDKLAASRFKVSYFVYSQYGWGQTECVLEWALICF